MRAIFKTSRIFGTSEANNAQTSTTNEWRNDEDPDSVASTTGSETRLIRAVHGAYRRWAYFIVEHAVLVIILSSLFSALCSIKIFFTPYKNDITGYTPYGARSRYEASIRESFFGQVGQGASFGTFLLLMPKNGKNILDENSLKEIVEIDDIVRKNITIFNHETNRRESFSQFCHDFCSLNDPVRNFYKGFQYQLERLSANEPLHSRIQLRYPLTTIYDRRFSIQPNFYGITFTEPLSGNRGNASTTLASINNNEISNMKSVEMIALIYRAERTQKWTDEEIKDYEMSISRYFENQYNSSNIQIMSLSTTYLEVEVVRAGLLMLPFLVFGFIIMIFCSTCTVLLSAVYMQQASVHKISLAVMACICPFMACGTALGLLLIGGLRFGSILLVTPFLVLAIGVDDAYLMIHAWQRVTKKMNRNAVKEDSVAYRLSLVLIDTGPAILISALTNITADAVGSLTGSPEITLLCIGNMASIFVDFIYQITFYSAVMAIVGQYEMRAEAREKSSAYKLSIPIGSVMDVSENSNMEYELKEDKWMPNRNYDRVVQKRQKKDCQRAFHDAVKDSFRNFVNNYVNFITNSFVASTVFILWIIYIVFSAWGISNFEVNLTTKKIFAEDSPLLIIDHIRVQQIVPFHTLATIFVNNPGNLSDPKRRDRINSLVYEMEHLPESWGPETTNYFMRDFLAFENLENVELDEEASNIKNEIEPHLNSLDVTKKPENFDIEDLKAFLEWPEYSFWGGFIHLGMDLNNKTIVEKFFFTTAYHGDQLKRLTARNELLHAWRRCVDRYPELNVSVFHDEGIFLDLVDNMPTDAWQSALATLLCMAAICFLFMYNIYTVLVASTIIASIIVGMLGLLSWQGVTMDPIMMAALIISVGFSVDIPAHVSYHYHSAGYENANLTVKDRLRITLASVGFPALQASLSTNLCVLSLLFVKLYMAHIFVQIMCLCIVMCVIHSLVIMPALFSLIELLTQLRNRSSTKSVKSSSNPSPIQRISTPNNDKI